MTELHKFKLMSHPSAYCHVRIELDNQEGSVQATLMSYETPVCGITYYADGDSFIWCTGNYSRTTIKHIGWFTRSFLGDNLYYEIKRELEYCDRCNRKFDGHFEYASIDLRDAQKSYFLDSVKRYFQSGDKWYRYSKTPNWYALNYSGRFEPIIL